jgi:hypothetical protein
MKAARACTNSRTHSAARTGNDTKPDPAGRAVRPRRRVRSCYTPSSCPSRARAAHRPWRLDRDLDHPRRWSRTVSRRCGWGTGASRPVCRTGSGKRTLPARCVRPYGRQGPRTFPAAGTEKTCGRQGPRTPPAAGTEKPAAGRARGPLERPERRNLRRQVRTSTRPRSDPPRRSPRAAGSHSQP